MWRPTSRMYFYEVAALCGIKVLRLREITAQLIENEKLLPDWVGKYMLDHPAITIIIDHLKINTEDENQIISILSNARDKKYMQRGLFNKIIPK